MDTVLIAALLTVAFIGIPTAVAIGRLSRPKVQTVGGASSKVEAVSTTVVEKKKEESSPSSHRWLWVILLAVAIAMIYALFHFDIIDLDMVQRPVNSLRDIFAGWTLWHGIVLAIILFAISWAMPKFKKAPWLTDTIGALGILVLFLTFINSGFGNALRDNLEDAERCVEFQDCGPRYDEVPTINGGTLDVQAGTTKVVRIKGTVVLQNRANYCLNISPEWNYAIAWSPDARRIYLTQLDNDHPEITTITSIPVGSEDCWH